MRSVASGGASALTEAGLGQREARLALMVAAVLNAILFKVRDAVDASGILGAVLGTFGISAIVWIGLAMAAHAVAREPDRPLSRRELALDLVVVVLMLLPVRHVGWLGVSLLALNILAHSARGAAAARGAWVLLAVTAPMFWSKIALTVFSGPILRFDAILVSTVLGLPRLGNAIALADGQTHLFIEEGCSSLLNLSLAVLCWTMFCQAFALSMRRTLGWCLAVCGVIVALNVGRICLIGAFPEQYDLLHGAPGKTVASWITVAAMLALFRFGMCRRARQSIVPKGGRRLSEKDDAEARA